MESRSGPTGSEEASPSEKAEVQVHPPERCKIRPESPPHSAGILRPEASQISCWAEPNPRPLVDGQPGLEGLTRTHTVLDGPSLDAVRIQLLVRQKDPEAFEGDTRLRRK